MPAAVTSNDIAAMRAAGRAIQTSLTVRQAGALAGAWEALRGMHGLGVWFYADGQKQLAYLQNLRALGYAKGRSDWDADPPRMKWQLIDPRPEHKSILNRLFGGWV